MEVVHKWTIQLRMEIIEYWLQCETMQDANEPAQLQRPAGKLKFRL